MVPCNSPIFSFLPLDAWSSSSSILRMSSRKDPDIQLLLSQRWVMGARFCRVFRYIIMLLMFLSNFYWVSNVEIVKPFTETGGWLFLEEEAAYFFTHLWLLISLTRSRKCCCAEVSSLMSLLGICDSPSWVFITSEIYFFWIRFSSYVSRYLYLLILSYSVLSPMYFFSLVMALARPSWALANARSSLFSYSFIFSSALVEISLHFLASSASRMHYFLSLASLAIESDSSCWSFSIFCFRRTVSPSNFKFGFESSVVYFEQVSEWFRDNSGSSFLSSRNTQICACFILSSPFLISSAPW